MGILIIFIIVFLVGLAGAILDGCDIIDGFAPIDILGIAVGFVGALVTLLMLSSVEENSQKTYLRLITERQAIQAYIQDSGAEQVFNVSRKITAFNDEVISVQMASKGFITREFYSKEVDWDSLELILWE